MNKRIVFCAVFITVAICVLITGGGTVPQVRACYGPCITANISSTQIYINETVTVKGEICPPAPNTTIRVAFTRPDYTWIEQYVLTDSETGEFTVTQRLDMAGYWNIFPIYGFICDRLYAVVIDPSPAAEPTPIPTFISPFKTNYVVIAVAVLSLSVGVAAVILRLRDKTRKISSIRLLVQIIFVYVLFAGIFIDHQNIPIPAAQLAPHELLAGTSLLGFPMPDGLPVPTFGCWYPCGRTVTCALWQIQVYIYPFWNAGGGWGVHYDTSGLTRLAVVLGAVVVAAIALGRFWCGWICPFGLYQDVITRIRKRFRIKYKTFSDDFNEKFHQLSYVILAVIIVVCVVFGAQAIFGTQLVPGTEKGGFVYGYFSAPFCQVCPMKPVCVLGELAVGVMKPEWIVSPMPGEFYQLGQYLTSLNITILIIVTAAAFFYRRSWCRICPLGALIALFNRFPPFKWVSAVRLDKVEEKCTKCGICKRVCPTQVKEVYEQKGGDVATSNCILCLRCVEMCPSEGCLNFKVAGKTAFKSRNWLEN
ncbi:MAG: 4Fe-4S binding protein [Candidatus Bathyarchaeia archaeon]